MEADKANTYKFRKKVLYNNNVYIIIYSNWYDMKHRVWPTNVNYGFSVTVTCHCRFTGFNNGGVPAQVRLYEKSSYIPLFCCDFKINKKIQTVLTGNMSQQNSVHLLHIHEALGLIHSTTDL